MANLLFDELASPRPEKAQKRKTEEGLFWELGGLRHNSEGPAVIRSKEAAALARSPLQEWWLHGKLHREDGPARIWNAWHEEWFQYGLLHRACGPAVKNGNTEGWFKKGHLHRTEGPAQIIGQEQWEWWKYGKRDRLSGPAIIRHPEHAKRNSLATEEWWCEGKLHRVDGPARIYPGARVEWWEAGQRVS